MPEIHTQSELFLEVERLSVHYGSVQILDRIDLQVHKGEVMALIGPNGAGKTTLIRTISGTVKPSAGHVRILGHRFENRSFDGRGDGPPAWRLYLKRAICQKHSPCGKLYSWGVPHIWVGLVGLGRRIIKKPPGLWNVQLPLICETGRSVSFPAVSSSGFYWLGRWRRIRR